ncbi:MAG: O-antigen ligase family protein [Prevotellaceae bacterium]|jgi:O-antigen ligase|nr:O-antigen ligase family protein [Prevotellaceae bacterium]
MWNKRNKELTAFFVTSLVVLCSITLFLSSRHFVNQEVTPKWFGLIAGVALTGIICSLLQRKVYLPAKSLFLLIFVSCCLIFFRSWVVSGFSSYLLTRTVCFILLFFVLQQAIPVLPARYLFGVFTLLATVLVFHGLLQYAGVFHSANSFRITGNFDNPAGFAVALTCVFPYVFYFFKNSRRTVRYIAALTVFVVFFTAILSGSRAAIVACIIVSVYFLFSEYSRLKLKKTLKILLVCVAIAIITGLYSMKKDSADGRLLIWQTTWNMIKDKPLAGHGYGAFNAQYMLYQAEYFDANPDSRYSELADNVLHPFNEYLLVLSEHGIVGLGIIVVLGLFVVRSYCRKPDCTKFIALMSLLSLAIFSCFSYPFKYPFSWITICLNLVIICPATEISSRSRVYLIEALMSAVASGLLFTGIILTKAEIKWNTIAHQSLAGKTTKVLPEYDKLYAYLNRNGLFLYNHAAELHEVKEYEKSLRVFDLCLKYYNDMDVQMLLADNYKESGRNDEAEKHLKLAAAMCPNRFMPLYRLVLLYKETNRNEEALALAQRIVDKKVKIPSSTVNAIKNKMLQLIENSQTEKVMPVSESRTNVEPLNL